MEDIETVVHSLTEQLRETLTRRVAIHGFLDDLLAATGARATGLWTVNEDELRQIGFRAVNDMADIVKREFADATLNVPLSQQGLGIVKAALFKAPAVASVEDSSGELGASALWLRRFGATQSLALPIVSQQQVVGVLAISTARLLAPEGDDWQIMTGVAAQIGEILSCALPEFD